MQIFNEVPRTIILRYVSFRGIMEKKAYMNDTVCHHLNSCFVGSVNGQPQGDRSHCGIIASNRIQGGPPPSPLAGSIP